LGITIPAEIIDESYLSEGMTLHVLPSEHGILLTPYDPVTDAALEAYVDLARRYANAFRRLAYDIGDPPDA